MPPTTLGTGPDGLQFTLFGRSRLLVADLARPSVFAYCCQARGQFFVPAEEDLEGIEPPYAKIKIVRKQARRTDICLQSFQPTCTTSYTIYAVTREDLQNEERCIVYKFREPDPDPDPDTR